MRRRPPVLVHFLDTDGTVACHGLELADCARPLNDEHPPLRICLDLCEVTCRCCLAVAEAREHGQARA